MALQLPYSVLLKTETKVRVDSGGKRLTSLVIFFLPRHDFLFAAAKESIDAPWTRFVSN
jgi:hypothetical protein